MIVVGEQNEDADLIKKIISKSSHICEWSTMMGRPICIGPHDPYGWWNAMKDWPEGGGYIDQTPWLVFKNHVKEKHGLDIKVFND